MYQKFKSLFSSAATVVQRSYDGFVNVVTGLNSARDKTTYSYITPSKKLTYSELDTLVREDPMAFKLAMKPAQEMTREKIEIDSPDPDFFHGVIDALNIYTLFRRAIFFENVFGGAVILLDIKDGKELDQPVDEKNIKEFGSRILVFDKSYFNVDNFNLFKKPEWYYINLGENGTTYIHESRLLVFSGNASTPNEIIQNNGFSDSLLQRLYPSIRNYSVAHDSAANILNDFSQTVYKLDGLNDDLNDDDGEQNVIKRMLLLEQTRSILKAVVLDGKDTFERNVSSVTGLKDFISIFREKLTSDTNYPDQILHGTAFKGGLGTAAQPEIISFYDYIAQLQKDLTPHWTRVLRYIALANAKNEPTFTYANLWQMDRKEESEIENKEADTFVKITTGYKNLNEMQAISPDEINQIITKKTDSSIFNRVAEKIRSIVKAAVYAD